MMGEGKNTRVWPTKERGTAKVILATLLLQSLPQLPAQGGGLGPPVVYAAGSPIIVSSISVKLTGSDDSLIWTYWHPECIDIYHKAVFSYSWGTKIGSDPDLVKFQTGCIIGIGTNCPAVLWVYKVQTTITTSTTTMESQVHHCSLSMTFCAAIPLIVIFKAVVRGLNSSKPQQNRSK